MNRKLKYQSLGRFAPLLGNNSSPRQVWGFGSGAGMPRAGAGRGRQCVGGVGSTAGKETGSDAPETKSPRIGFPGVGFGGSGGGGPGDADQSVIRPPARYPLGGGEIGPLIGHRLGDSGVGLAPLLPTIRTRTELVLTTRSLIGPPTRSR